MNKNFKKKFLKGSIATSLGQFSTIAFHFFSIMLLSRFISKEVLGVYFLIITISFLFQKLSSLGLELTLVKFIAQNESTIEEPTVFAPVLLLRTIQLAVMSVIFLLFYQLILQLFDDVAANYKYLIIVIFTLGSYRELLFNLLQGLKKYSAYAIAQVISAFSKFLLILIFLETTSLTIEYLMFIEIFIYSVTILAQILFIPSSNFKITGINKILIKKILKFSIPLYLNNILTVINDRINTFIIAAFLSSTSIANFEVAKKVPEAFARIFHSFIIVYFPNIASLFSEDKKKDAQDLLNQSVTILSAAILFCVSVALLFQKEIVILLFSDKYVVVSFAFVMLMFNFYLRAISNILGYSLVAAGHSSVPVKVNSITSAVNIGAGIILIPKLGFEGAVVSLILMNFLTLLLNYVFLFKYDIIVKAGIIMKPLIPFALLSLAYISFPIDNFGIKIFALIIYLILTFLMVKETKKILYFGFNKLLKNRN